MRFKDWAIQQHKDTNHMYDKYLPYEFHLRLVDSVHQEFYDASGTEIKFSLLSKACFGHDLIEDTRVTFNDVLKALELDPLVQFSYHAELVAEIIRSVTNYGRGRNRYERMPNFVYDDIKATPGAVYIKLCDRIANVRYGILTNSPMHLKYKDEQKNFKSRLYTGEYEIMWNELDKLLKIK